MRILLLALTMLLGAGSAQALDLTKMTPEEEAAFGAAVREYLLSHPDVLLEVIDVIEQDRAEARANADVDLVMENHAAIFEDENDFVGGNPEGDITLVEFLDYQCGWCRTAHPEVAALLKKDGNIRLVIKEFPVLGEGSVLAARFALSVKAVAGDAAYGEIHDIMMTFRGEFSDASLRALAERQGLDAEAIMAGMNAPEIDEILNRNHALARVLSIDGTPGFVLDDQLLRGYVPADAMEALLAQARS